MSIKEIVSTTTPIIYKLMTGNDSFTSLPTNVNQILETEKGARMKTYTVEEIRLAVDIVIGDDGGRAEEVIEVLAYNKKRWKTLNGCRKERQE